MTGDGEALRGALGRHVQAFLQAARGRFELHRVMSVGGMGVVLHVADRQLGGEAALKLMLDPGADARALERFRREGRALAAIDHPNVVKVFDQGELGGRPFLVMEFIRGLNLQHLIDRYVEQKQRPPKAKWTCGVLQQIADALAACHAAGIIHRDVKPANIVLETATNRPVLVDFGVVGQESGGESFAGTLTAADDMVGTPLFMAPEQLDTGGELGEVGPAADVWALGAVLFAGLTGRPPAGGESLVELVAARLTSAPLSPAARNPRVSPVLDELCRRAMATRPEERPAMAELARELDELPVEAYLDSASGSVILEGPVTVTLTPARVGVALGFSLFLLILTIGLWLESRRQSDRRDSGVAVLASSTSAPGDPSSSQAPTDEPTAADPAPVDSGVAAGELGGETDEGEPARIEAEVRRIWETLKRGSETSVAALDDGLVKAAPLAKRLPETSPLRAEITAWLLRESALKVAFEAATTKARKAGDRSARHAALVALRELAKAHPEHPRIKQGATFRAWLEKDETDWRETILGLIAKDLETDHLGDARSRVETLRPLLTAFGDEPGLSSLAALESELAEREQTEHRRLVRAELRGCLRARLITLWPALRRATPDRIEEARSGLAPVKSAKSGGGPGEAAKSEARARAAAVLDELLGLALEGWKQVDRALTEGGVRSLTVQGKERRGRVSRAGPWTWVLIRGSSQTIVRAGDLRLGELRLLLAEESPAPVRAVFETFAGYEEAALGRVPAEATWSCEQGQAGAVGLRELLAWLPEFEAATRIAELSRTKTLERRHKRWLRRLLREREGLSATAAVTSDRAALEKLKAGQAWEGRPAATPEQLFGGRD